MASILEHGLLRPGTRVLAAVSGGADSVAMLSVLCELAGPLKLGIVVGHLNHCIRGKAATADAAFVRRLARKFKLPAEIGRADVPRLAREGGVSVEMAAREARYEFLARVAHRRKCSAVATAHTMDDQAETVLLKLARGAGAGGLGGIRRKNVMHGVIVVRPLLDIARADIVAHLGALGLRWREDRTNTDQSYLRNRVRHKVLPFLSQTMNPGIHRALARAGDVLGVEDEWMDSFAAMALLECVGAGGKNAIMADRLAKLHPALRRRVLRQWLVAGGVPVESVDYDAVMRVEQLTAAGEGGRSGIVGAGWLVSRAGDRMLLEQDILSPAAFEMKVKVPGETRLAAQKLCIKAVSGRGIIRQKPAGAGSLPAAASLDARVGRPGHRLVVRSWRAGDRMSPLGMSGSRKVQDILTDAKLTKSERNAVPIFECDGEIVWIPGYMVARGWSVKDESSPSLRLSVVRQ